MSGKAYEESGVSIAIPAPENPAKKAKRKLQYDKSFIENLVNWEFVESQLD